MSDGSEPELSLNWEGICIHGIPDPPSSIGADTGRGGGLPVPDLPAENRATKMAFNSAFSLIAVGTTGYVLFAILIVCSNTELAIMTRPTFNSLLQWFDTYI